MSIPDYLPVRTRNAVRLAARTQRNHANIGKLSSIWNLVRCAHNWECWNVGILE
jgi:hypothetical protein